MMQVGARQLFEEKTLYAIDLKGSKNMFTQCVAEKSYPRLL